MLVLGIETSCDETGVALYDTERGLVADALYSQIEMHANYGGVVPELASRDHVRKLLPMIAQLLDEAGVDSSELQGIAYTHGPGLVGALLVGATLAHSLAEVWDIPVVGVHHMEGHLLAPMLEENAPRPPLWPCWLVVAIPSWLPSRDSVNTSCLASHWTMRLVRRLIRRPK